MTVLFMTSDVIRYGFRLSPLRHVGAETVCERADFDAPFRVRYPAIENLAILPQRA
jgi:hypothetical protein